jgi:hypothetical protein
MLSALSPPVAMVLDVRGRVEVQPMEGASHRITIGELLYAGERLAVPADGSATLAFLGIGARERLRPAIEATVGPDGCAPSESVAERRAQRPAVASALKGVRPATDASRKAGVVFRGVAARLPESPPAVSPMFGAMVASERPSLSWEPDAGAKGYRVRLLSSAGRELWEAESAVPSLAYPKDEEALQPSYLYSWEIADLEGNTLVRSRFAVARRSVARQMAALAEQADSDDPAELLEAALAYSQLEAFGDALAMYERLARRAPDEPVYQEALAELYRRAGRPEEAAAAEAKTSRSEAPQ